MSSNVHSLPLVQVNARLQKFCDFHDLSDFLTAFEMAIESRLGRQQFHSTLQQYIDATPPSLDDLRKMVKWADQVSLKKYDPSPPPKPAFSPEFEAGLNTIKELGAEVAKGDQTAEDHQYWFFRPAWQVQSAFWNELFGEHDPAVTVARYARLSFKSYADERSSASKEICLSDEDVESVGRLIDHLKGSLQSCKGINPIHVRTILTGAIGAEHLFNDRLPHDQIPFETILRSAAQSRGLPHWIAENILQFWTRSIDATYGDDLSELDGASKKLLVLQARFFGEMLITYVSADDSAGTDIPNLDYISDLSITEVLHTIDWLLAEDFKELERLFHDIMEAIDRARVRKFRGRLPFSFYEASSLYQDTYLETWISQIASYSTERYDDYMDRYSCNWLLAEQPKITRRDKRENALAIMRYREYRAALDEMRRDGLHELASAWWAFFIASQAFAFRGHLAVPPDMHQEILEVASEFKDDQSIVKALRFVVDNMPDDEEDVISLAVRASSQKVIRELDAKSFSANILELGHSAEQQRAWLEKNIGPEAWANLADGSQDCLIKAEQLLSLLYRELGRRRDWYFMVMLSARAIEVEMRDKLKEVLDRIVKETGHSIKVRTLGGCLDAIRAARQKKECLSPILASCVASLGDFMDRHNKDQFINKRRISASHGTGPISLTDLGRWRELIFNHKIFDVVIKTGRSFNALHVA